MVKCYGIHFSRNWHDVLWTTKIKKLFLELLRTKQFYLKHRNNWPTQNCSKEASEISQLRSGWNNRQNNFVLKGQRKTNLSGVLSGHGFLSVNTSHFVAG
jgi:hypothetical protein